MRRKLAILALLLLPGGADAHVGSPNVFYEGKAGPYPVRIVVRPPGVVPGLAEISIRVADDGVRRVTALPVFWKAGRKGAPPPDEARLVRGETNLYTTELWLMKTGAYSVNVEVEGARGVGSVVVPVNSVAISRRPMAPWFGGLLSALGLMLFVGAVRIVGAAFGEATLGPNEAPNAHHRRSSYLAMGIATPIFIGLLAIGKTWWDREDSNFRNNRLYKPVDVSATVRREREQNILRLAVDPSDHRRARWTRLIPDHGKMMHLFLIREPALDAFAHLHPVQRDRDTFEVALPALPPGNYRAYADVTQENGFAHTLVATAAIPEPPAPEASTGSAIDALFLPPDPDDSWHLAKPRISPSSNGDPQDPQSSSLPNGCVMLWERTGSLHANREASLRFTIVDAKRQPVPLQPYMGMLAHAAVRREDGSVFAHLHPVGSISMASQEFFTRAAEHGAETNEPPPEENSEDHSQHHMGSALQNTVAFPYEFPRSGRYRIWVQVKTMGNVVTGVFDAEVLEGKPGR